MRRTRLSRRRRDTRTRSVNSENPGLQDPLLGVGPPDLVLPTAPSSSSSSVSASVSHASGPSTLSAAGWNRSLPRRRNRRSGHPTHSRKRDPQTQGQPQPPPPPPPPQPQPQPKTGSRQRITHSDKRNSQNTLSRRPRHSHDSLSVGSIHDRGSQRRPRRIRRRDQKQQQQQQQDLRIRTRPGAIRSKPKRKSSSSRRTQVPVSTSSTTATTTTTTTTDSDSFVSTSTSTSTLENSAAPGLAQNRWKRQKGKMNEERLAREWLRDLPSSAQVILLETKKPMTVDYSSASVVGTGCFGVVFRAILRENRETVAVKKVFQDRRYKNREVLIMKAMAQNPHPCCIKLLGFYFDREPKERRLKRIALLGTNLGEPPSESDSEDGVDLYLYLVMEYMPDSISRFVGSTRITSKTGIPWLYIKLFAYQLFRALSYLHLANLCHRDLKPANILISATSGRLKLCDFGSAKQLRSDQPNVPYICSRYYRAPELVAGQSQYTWSVGCVIAEMVLGVPVFLGESSVDQLPAIVNILGSPTSAEAASLSPKLAGLDWPTVPARPWVQVFRRRVISDDMDPSVCDLLRSVLRYNPAERIRPIDALAHPFFDVLRQEQTRLPSGRRLPSSVLYRFSLMELKTSSYGVQAIEERLVPEWYRLLRNPPQ